MEQELKCNQVGMLSGGKWDKLHDTNRRVYAADGISPTITTMGGGQREVKILVPEATKKGYDTATYGNSINMAYPNSKTRRGRVGHGVAQTLTTGDSQQVVIEPLALDEQNGYIRQDGCVGTLTTDGSSPKHNNRVVEPNYRFFEQAFETLRENDCEVGDTIDAFNKRVNKDGVSPTITTRPDGFKTAILPVTQEYRIRKLTENECGRLMGVKSEDCEKIAKNQSTSSQYHLYGDAICVPVLMAIFGSLLGVRDYEDKITDLVNELKQGD